MRVDIQILPARSVGRGTAGEAGGGGATRAATGAVGRGWVVFRGVFFAARWGGGVTPGFAGGFGATRAARRCRAPLHHCFAMVPLPICDGEDL